MILYVKYIRVTGRGDEPTLKDFLYGGTSIMQYVDIPDSELPGGYPKNQFIAILRTESEHSETSAEYLANTQAGRLGSNMWNARVFDDYGDLQDWERENPAPWEYTIHADRA